MLKIAYDKTDHPFSPGNLSLTWANKNQKTGEWEILYWPSGCRTYMNCYWYHSQYDKDYGLGMTPTKEETPAPSSDYTGVFYSCGTPAIAYMKRNIALINEWEEKYGLKKTEYVIADDPTGLCGVIFIGDPAWRSNHWKITLYTYLLKRVLHSTVIPDTYLRDDDYGIKKGDFKDDYWGSLDKNGNLYKLLAKVKDFNEEELVSKNYNGVHVCSGFHTICGGIDNKYMTKLLLGDKE